MSEVALKTKEKSTGSAVRGEKRSVRRENRTGIPTQLKERMEESTGLSFDDVRVHYNSALPAKLDALAYTKGNQVEIGPGQERHLPHELGHVVQQKLGMVRANGMHSSGVALNTEARLERQADEIGAGKRIPIVQRMGWNVVQRSPDFPDDAQVIRGGTCKAKEFWKGRGVTDMNGVPTERLGILRDGDNINKKLKGISVNCARQDEVTLEQLVEPLHKDIKKYGTSTVGAIQAPSIGGVVEKKSLPGNRYHCEISNISAREGEELFQNVRNRVEPREGAISEEVISEETIPQEH